MSTLQFDNITWHWTCHTTRPQFSHCFNKVKQLLLIKIIISSQERKFFLVRVDFEWRLIESMMELRPRQGNLWLVFRLFSLMQGLPSIRLK